MVDHETFKKKFESDGFLHLPRFLSAAEFQVLEENLRRFLQGVVPVLPRIEAMYEDYEDPASLKQVKIRDDPYFEGLKRDPKLLALAQLLLEDDPVPQAMQFFNKPPGKGKATPPHQDGYYFNLVPCEALTFWIALDDVDEENGAVTYVRGSHLAGIRAHMPTDILGFSQGLKHEWEAAEEVLCPVQKGDCLVHHCLTIHSAGANRSVNRFRRAIGVVYHAARARVDQAAHRRYLESLRQQHQRKGLG